MRRRHALQIAFAALLGALAIFALPALAGAKGEDHHRGGHDRSEHRHHHGDRDRHPNVGKISAFDAGSGELTIARFGGGTISGLVNGATEIKCEGIDDRFDHRGARFSRDGGGSGPGGGSDSSGPGSGGESSRGEEEPGDDHGEGFEPGDDNGGRDEEEPGDDHNDRVCTSAELTVGTVVHEAHRDFHSGVATFDEIELAHTR